MLVAEKGCVPETIVDSYWFSTELQKKGQSSCEAKRQLQIGILNELARTAIDKARKKQQNTIMEIKMEHQNDKQYLSEMVKELTKERFKPWKMKEEQVLKVLLNAENEVISLQR